MNDLPQAGARGGDEQDVVATRLILAAAALLYIGLRWLALDIPLERDEGEYAYIAQRLLHGEVPYRDAFDQKPPAIFLAYLVPVALFGPSAAAIHGFLALWNAATACFVYLIARALSCRRSAAFAALTFSLVSFDSAWLGTAANTEAFMILPMTAAVWCALRGTGAGSLRWWFLAGFLSLAACLFKQVAATNIGLLALIAASPTIVGAPPSNRSRVFRIGATFLAGGAAALIPIVVWFVSAGAWREFADCVFWHNLRYAQKIPPSVGFMFLAMQLLKQSESQIFLWIFAAATLCNWRPASRKTALFTGVWLACSALGVSASLYFREHYFLQLAPVLAVMVGCTAGTLPARFLRSPTLLQSNAVSVLLVLAIAGPFLNAQKVLWLGDDGYTRGRLIYGKNPFPESAEYAAKIRAESSPDDRVFIFGSEPQILFLAERRSVTRYIFLYPATMNIPGVRERQKEIVKELQQHPPRVILMTDLQMSLLKNARTPPLLEDHVNKLIENEYRLVGLRRFDGGEFQLLAGDSARETWRQAPPNHGENESGPRIDMRLYVRQTKK